LQKLERSLGTGRPQLYHVINTVDYLYQLYNNEREDILDSFLRIVFSEAKHKTSDHVSLQDNFQNGYFGLIKASKTYDQRKKVPFGTFAKNWIKERILKQMPVEGNTIYIPNIVHQKANKEKEKKEKGEHTSEHFIKITNRVVTYSLDDVNKDDPDSLPLHNTIEDKNDSIAVFEHSHFNNTLLGEISEKWNNEEKTIVFLKEGMLENLPKKSDITINGRLLEMIHQLYDYSSFSDLLFQI
jgi:RNA polymerase sigma factor (sigma-70 family)